MQGEEVVYDLLWEIDRLRYGEPHGNPAFSVRSWIAFQRESDFHTVHTFIVQTLFLWRGIVTALW
jgi:hypothetical protein